jgi:hypothetical protein
MIRCDVRINHRGFNVFVPEQRLNGSDIRYCCQQVAGKTVSERMRSYMFIDLLSPMSSVMIIKKADQYSVANNLMGGQGAAIAQQPATPLHQRLVTELRRLVTEAWPINRPGGVAFMADGSDTIWLVSKRSLDELRASMIGQGQTGIPPNPRIMDELMQHGYLNTSQEDKASRRVRITIGDWEQALTCIGLRISKIWGSSKPPQPDKPAQVSIDGESTQPVPEDLQSQTSTPTISLARGSLPAIVAAA